LGEQVLTVKQVADRYQDQNITARQVLYAIKSKKLQATKYGWQWFVEEINLPETFPLREYNRRED
jgi:hypothetical protein